MIPRRAKPGPKDSGVSSNGTPCDQIEPIGLPSLRMASIPSASGARLVDDRASVGRGHEKINWKRCLHARLQVLPVLVTALMQLIVSSHVRDWLLRNMRDCRRRAGDRAGVDKLNADLVITWQSWIKLARSHMNCLEAGLVGWRNGDRPIDANHDNMGSTLSCVMLKGTGTAPCDHSYRSAPSRWELSPAGVNSGGKVKRTVVPAGIAYPGTVGSADLSNTNQASNGCLAASPVLIMGW
jgi:hypothetical protein